jgi:GT2 family glycosyltransferase
MPPRTRNPLPEPAPDLPEEARRPSRSRPAKPAPPVVVDVTAVLVAHDGAAWLPEALSTLAASTRRPSRVVCVDTGSTDGSAALMAAAYGEVLHLPRDTGYGAAVAAALGSAPMTGWVWLLHDDVAVEPTTLQALLEHAATSPSAVLLGPKARDWNDPRVLVEVGLTTDAAGHRETGLERREYDQGQHDAVRDVLAVGTAGALVRRDVWDAVGGLDPELPVFRDDLDLGWKVNAAGHRVVVVPQARVRHARAATTGHRETDAAPGRATGTDREHALYVLLAHASALRLLGLLPRLVLGTVFRSLGLLLTRQVADAGDEWRALLATVGRPGRIRRARRDRAALRTVPHSALTSLFASRTVRLRARLGALGDWMSGGGAPGANPLGALGDPGPEGPDDLDVLDARSSGALRRLLLRPGTLLVAGLSVVTLVAERSVLPFTSGSLHGGALLGTPAGTRDLWSAYLAAWHDVSVGTSRSAPPGVAALAALSTLTFGKPWLAVDLLLLLSVPLAGLTAYLAASRLVRHLYLRLWAAATWALLPVATGAVAAGRLDAAALQVALPLLVLAAGRLLTDDPRIEGWWRAWALGLALGVTCAFAPLLWPLSAVVLLVGAGVNLALTGGRRRALAAVIVAAVPGALLFPWSLQALQHPSMFVLGPQVADRGVPAWHLLLLSPGGPGLPAVALTAGLLLGGLAGTVRLAYRGLALACWGAALVGLASAVLLARVQVGGLPVWPGPALQLTALAVLTAALVAANGARSRLARSSFGWRQLLSGLVAVAAVALPVLAAAGWTARGVDGPLHRDSRVLLPAFAQAELQASPGLRVLVVAPDGSGRLRYDLTGPDGNGVQDTALSPTAAQRKALDAVVADLASPRGSDAAEALSTRAVRYVALRTGPGTDVLAAGLDAQTGLVRRTSGSVVLWQVVAPAARLSVLEPTLARQALTGVRAPTSELLRSEPPVASPAGRESARASLPAGAPGRLLVLADARDGGWHATVAGKELPRRTAWGWAQAFDLPATGGHLELHHSHGPRRLALALQLLLLLVVVVLAAPGSRRGRGLEDDLELEEDDVPRRPDRFVPVAAP